MNKFNIQDMHGGWFVGDFLPTMYKTRQCEVAYKEYEAGFVDQKHHHRKATELTLIVKGKAKFNENIIETGEGVVIFPGESVEFTALEETATVVVKVPGATNDKYLD